ncbi:hypothetical protein P3T73_08110 [Kiritimatiellota bacterium B12222]|nr:hypothetical protein P3T73_08110 [Kiritimatiellota bacterium B12222]
MKMMAVFGVVVGLICGVHAEMVADWRFSENPGFLQDSSGAGVTLSKTEGDISPKETDTAMETVARFYGEGFLFSEDDGRWADNTMTVEVLFRVENAEMEAVQTLIGKWNQESPGTSWVLGVKNQRMIFYMAKEGSERERCTGPEIISQKVYYVALVMDDRKVTLYVKNITDEGEMSKKVYHVTPRKFKSTDLPLSIGSTSQPSSPFWGEIGRVRIHDTALDPIKLLWF